MGVWMVFCLSVLVLWQTCPGCTLLPALWQLIKASGPVWTKQQKMDRQTSHCTLFLFSDANRELDDTGWKYTLICTKLNQTFVQNLDFMTAGFLSCSNLHFFIWSYFYLTDWSEAFTIGNAHFYGPRTFSSQRRYQCEFWLSFLEVAKINQKESIND